MTRRTDKRSFFVPQSLTMNNEAKREFKAGSVVNLMAIDCQRIQDVTSNLWIVLSAPLQVSACFSLSASLSASLSVCLRACVCVCVCVFVFV